MPQPRGLGKVGLGYVFARRREGREADVIKLSFLVSLCLGVRR
jgi:hypothetical protein